MYEKMPLSIKKTRHFFFLFLLKKKERIKSKWAQRLKGVKKERIKKEKIEFRGAAKTGGYYSKNTE